MRPRSPAGACPQRSATPGAPACCPCFSPACARSLPACCSCSCSLPRSHSLPLTLLAVGPTLPCLLCGHMLYPACPPARNQGYRIHAWVGRPDHLLWLAATYSNYFSTHAGPARKACAPTAAPPLIPSPSRACNRIPGHFTPTYTPSLLLSTPAVCLRKAPRRGRQLQAHRVGGPWRGSHKLCWGEVSL